MKDDNEATIFIKRRFAEAKAQMEESDPLKLKIQPCPNCVLFFNKGIQAGLDKAVEIVNRPTPRP